MLPVKAPITITSDHLIAVTWGSSDGERQSRWMHGRAPCDNLLRGLVLKDGNLEARVWTQALLIRRVAHICAWAS